MKKRLLPIFFILFLSLFCNLAYAIPFTIIPKVGTSLPTTVTSGSSVFAYYTVINNTLAERSQNYVKFLPPNVTQVTSGGTYSDTCGATFNLAGKGQSGSSCTLQLQISGPVSNNSQDQQSNLFVCFPGGITCVGTYQKLEVTQVSTKPPVILNAIAVTPGSANVNINATQQYSAQGIYTDGSTVNLTSKVTWHTSSSAVATITVAGLAKGVAAGNTNITATYATLTSNAALLSVANNVVSISISPNPGFAPVGGPIQFAATAKFANNATQVVTTQATWGTSNTAIATIGATTGLATGVAIGTANVTAIYAGVTGSIAMNVTTYIYMGTAASQPVYCALNGTGIGTCAKTGGTAASSTYGTAVNPAGTAVYIGDDSTSGKIFYCTIAADASLNACVNTATAGSFRAFAVALNSAGTVLFVATEGANIMVCNVSGASVTGCVNTGSGMSGAILGFTLNAANTYAYASNTSGTIFSCHVNAGAASTTTLTSCTSTGSAFSFPYTLSVNPAGTYLYGTSGAGVNYCAISATTGLLSACAVATTGQEGLPRSVAISPSGTIAYIGNSYQTIYACAINVDGTIASNCPNNSTGFGTTGFNSISFGM
jgi:hypothetical protein